MRARARVPCASHRARAPRVASESPFPRLHWHHTIAHAPLAAARCSQGRATRSATHSARRDDGTSASSRKPPRLSGRTYVSPPHVTRRATRHSSEHPVASGRGAPGEREREGVEGERERGAPLEPSATTSVETKVSSSNAVRLNAFENMTLRSRCSEQRAGLAVCGEPLSLRNIDRDGRETAAERRVERHRCAPQQRSIDIKPLRSAAFRRGQRVSDATTERGEPGFHSPRRGRMRSYRAASPRAPASERA